MIVTDHAQVDYKTIVQRAALTSIPATLCAGSARPTSFACSSYQIHPRRRYKAAYRLMERNFIALHGLPAGYPVLQLLRGNETARAATTSPSRRRQAGAEHAVGVNYQTTRRTPCRRRTWALNTAFSCVDRERLNPNHLWGTPAGSSNSRIVVATGGILALSSPRDQHRQSGIPGDPCCAGTVNDSYPQRVRPFELRR